VQQKMMTGVGVEGTDFLTGAECGFGQNVFVLKERAGRCGWMNNLSGEHPHDTITIQMQSEV
jgi:hypothetical protein